MSDITEVILKGSCDGQAIYNVLHFRNNGDLAISTLITAFNIGAAGLINEWANVACTGYAISSILSRSGIDTTPGPQIETSLGTTVTGGAGDIAGALPASGVIKWLTATGGRSGRGRSYLGPLGQELVANGLITAGSLTNMQDVVDIMNGTFNVAGGDYNGNWEFGIWSRVLSQFFPVVDGVVRNAVKTQRRRQLGVGI